MDSNFDMRSVVKIGFVTTEVSLTEQGLRPGGYIGKGGGFVQPNAPTLYPNARIGDRVPDPIQDSYSSLARFLDRQDHAKRIPVKVKLVHPFALMPEYGHPTDSCFDLFAVDYHDIRPNEVCWIDLGVTLQAPPDYEFVLEDKSGMALAGISTRGGIIDAGFTGVWSVILVNEGIESYIISRGQKIVQARVQPRYVASFELTDSITSRDRGDNGHGSTGLTSRPQ